MLGILVTSVVLIVLVGFPLAMGLELALKYFGIQVRLSDFVAMGMYYGIVTSSIAIAAALGIAFAMPMLTILRYSIRRHPFLTLGTLVSSFLIWSAIAQELQYLFIGIIFLAWVVFFVWNLVRESIATEMGMPDEGGE